MSATKNTLTIAFNLDHQRNGHWNNGCTGVATLQFQVEIFLTIVPVHPDRYSRNCDGDWDPGALQPGCSHFSTAAWVLPGMGV